MKGPDGNKEVKVLAVIPARGGSKGIPGKNITDLCGHPLIYYTIREAHKSKLIDATIVSTDDEEIAEVARGLGADVPFLRPKELATDGARDIGFMQHALEWVEKERGWKPEVMLFIPPTSPSRTAEDIDQAIQFLYDTNADSVRTMVHPPHFNPFKMWVEEGEEGRVEPIFSEARGNIPRQQIKKFYMPTAIAYVTRSKYIKEGQIWGPDVRMVPFPLERFTDIDYPQDLEEAERVLRKFNLI
jgi:CMP-N,N'-diacetyllegionaminic acid synthase